MWFRRSSIALLAATVCACSAFVSGDLLGKPSTEPICGEPPSVPSRAPPVFDAFMTGVFLAGAIVVVGTGVVAGALLLAPAGVFGVSAVGGFGDVRQCESLVRERAKPIDCTTVKEGPDVLRARGRYDIVDKCYGSNAH